MSIILKSTLKVKYKQNKGSLLLSSLPLESPTPLLSLLTKGINSFAFPHSIIFCASKNTDSILESVLWFSSKSLTLFWQL
jgi:hypothetical protein